MQMFRARTDNKPAVTLGYPNINKKLVDGPDEEVLEQRLEVTEYKVQPYGTSTRQFTNAYRAQAKTNYEVKFNRADVGQFGALLSDARAWQDNKDNEARARRILRGPLATQAMQPALDKMFRMGPGVTLPTGQALVTTFTDFAKISSMLQRNDFENLVRPETIQAIARGVFYRVSTPLFSAFVAYLNSPTAGLLPPQLSSRELFIDLVRRAVLAQNPAYGWPDFVSPVNATQATTSAPGSSANAATPPVTQPAKGMDDVPVSSAGEGKISGRG